MGCGASKDTVGEQAHVTKKTKFIFRACKDRLHLAIADIACKNVTVAASSHEYIPLGNGEEDGNGEELVEEQTEDTTIERNVVSDNHDESEYQENRPPPYQQVTVHQQADTAVNPNSATNHVKKDPLRELSLTHDGKLVDMLKENHVETSAIYALSPRKQNSYSYGGISPSLWPSMKSKGHQLSSPRYMENLRPLAPVQQTRPVKNVSFVKETDALSPRGKLKGSCEPDAVSPRGKSSELSATVSPTEGGSAHNDATLNDLEELLKSEMSIMNIDEFIENLVADRHQTKKQYDQLISDSNLSASPNTYMKELLEHFDKSTESLHMQPTLGMDSWQSKLLETIDKDIDILLNDQVEVASLGKDNQELTSDVQTSHTLFESIEL